MRNVYSVCLLLDYWVVVVLSFGGDELLIYEIISVNGSVVELIVRFLFWGVYGVMWDSDLGCLWVLGFDEFFLFDFEDGIIGFIFDVVKCIEFLMLGGYDLMCFGEFYILFVIINKYVYCFNK